MSLLPLTARAVNNPELLPRSPGEPVIDLLDYMSKGQEARLKKTIADVEKLGYKLRILTQEFPNTPGEAVKEYWGLDDTSIVIVADESFGKVLNFNLGSEASRKLPGSFITRLRANSKWGNQTPFKEKRADANALGVDQVLIDAAQQIEYCLRPDSSC